MLVIGEVRTCLLHNAESLPQPVAAQLLELVPGRRVLSAGRPVGRSVSPELTVGVDCRLATKSRKGVRGTARGIGTVTSHAVITAGSVLQGSAKTHVRHATADHRLAWSHYAGQPGVIEVISPADTADFAAGYLADTSPQCTLDLGSVSGHLISSVQMNPQLDHITRVRSRLTRVCWAAGVSDSDTPVARVHAKDDLVRTIELKMPKEQLGLAARFCEDFALHDWLLTTVTQVIEQADRAEIAGQEAIDILKPAVKRLLHLWMPGTFVDPAMRTLWDALERQSGFSLQWNAQAVRIRDWIDLRTLQALERVRHSNLE
ncbi:MAG: SCO2521 family protein [Pseudonocardiaceae bacterium]